MTWSTVNKYYYLADKNGFGNSKYSYVVQSEQFSWLIALRFELKRGRRTAFSDKPTVLAMFIKLFSSRGAR
jgi:hypothetical protein